MLRRPEVAMDYVWLLFSFRGRINRAEFWLAGLIVVCWMMFLVALIVSAGHFFRGSRSFSFGINDIFRIVDPETLRSLSSPDLLPVLIKTFGTPLFLWVYLATAIKRLHDRDKSPWWMVPFFVVPGVFDQFEDRLDDSYPVLLVALISIALGTWGFIELCFLKGTRGTNRFGPDPLAPVAPIDTRPRWDQHSELEFVPHSAGPSPGSHVKRGA
jgi:uncharacterized membrane protein YhaH (DUF805 family)